SQAAVEFAKKHLAAAKDKPAAEVPLVHEDFYARADALIPREGGYVLRETKASTFPLKADRQTPDDPKDHYVDDVAIQKWVAESSGVSLVAAELNLLDSKWRYPGGDDYSGLFRQLNVTVAADAKKAQVPTWIEKAR